MSEEELLPYIKTAMLAEMETQRGPVQILTQKHFAPVIERVLLQFVGQPINSKLLATMVASKLCIMRP